jgi:hypothetical protein
MDRRFEIGQMAFVVTGVILAALGVDQRNGDFSPINHRITLMTLLKMLSKPGALVSGWTSAVLCFSAASGFWLAGERGRAICWTVIGAVEVIAIVF